MFLACALAYYRIVLMSYTESLQVAMSDYGYVLPFCRIIDTDNFKAKK